MLIFLSEKITLWMAFEQVQNKLSLEKNLFIVFLLYRKVDIRKFVLSKFFDLVKTVPILGTYRIIFFAWCLKNSMDLYTAAYKSFSSLNIPETQREDILQKHSFLSTTEHLFWRFSQVNEQLNESLPNRRTAKLINLHLISPPKCLLRTFNPLCISFLQRLTISFSFTWNTNVMWYPKQSIYFDSYQPIVGTVGLISGLVFFSFELTALILIVTWFFTMVARWFGLVWVLLWGLLRHSVYGHFIWSFQTIEFQLLSRCDTICSYVPFSKCAGFIDFFRWGGILA